jgi:hypothetical protein
MACFVVWRTTRRAPVAATEKGEFKDALVAAQTFAPIEDLKTPAAVIEQSHEQGPT